MLLTDFDYDLPPELIAQTPLNQRDNSRLLVIDRQQKTIQHRYFYDLPNLLTGNENMVLNESRVIPARLHGTINHKPVEVLLLHPEKNGDWDCLIRPGRAFKPDTIITFAPDFSATVRGVSSSGRILKFSSASLSLTEALARYGEMPTPPYIKTKLTDPERYQTVYSVTSGSVAAPTAGLHFTPEMLQTIKQKIPISTVTLHVGAGTFQPVKTEKIEDHPMHAESFSLLPTVATSLNQAKTNGQKILAVGTTTCRVLESCADPKGHLTPQDNSTNIFIYPGYKWRCVDQLITNLHLPKSTLLMLVTSFIGDLTFTKEIYRTAVQEKYRFFSFGDAMYIK